MNPFTDVGFFEFFGVIVQRLGMGLAGKLSLGDLASDELQLLTLMGVNLSASFVGVFFVLRKMTMLANSLSHTILLGIVALALLCGGGGVHSSWAFILAAFVMGIVTTFLTEGLSRWFILKDDASNALVFTGLFSLGILLANLFLRDAHLGIEAVLGNVDGVQAFDAQFILWIALVNGLCVLLFFRPYVLIAFNPQLAQVMGFSVVFYNYLQMIQLSLIAIGSFRVVGVLLFLAFLTLPLVTARFISQSVKQMIFFSLVIGSVASCLGVAFTRSFFSYFGLALSTGGIVVCFMILLFVFCLLFKRGWEKFPKRKFFNNRWIKNR